MANLAFIQQTDLKSGKIVSPSARRTIRTHVMRTYWKKRFVEGCHTADPPAILPEGSNERNCPPLGCSPMETFIPKAASNESMASHGAGSPDNGRTCLEGSPTTVQEEATPSPRPSHFLNRATDAFIYAGSSIDVKSYGFFSHYAAEC